MKDYSNQTFTSNGRKYTFVAVVSSGDEKLQFTLDNMMVECFEYESALNDLVVRGSITYTDQYGNIDKLLERPSSHCQVLFVRNDIKYDGDIEIEKPSEIERFEQNFLVENLTILERQGDSVKYKIELVTTNIYKCLANIDYTNYNTGNEQIFDIIKGCFQKSELVCDAESFDKTKTKVKIPYITNGNDDAFSVTKHLLNKLYYLKDKDDSVKFLFYNYYRDMYQLFDMKNEKTATGTETVILSLLRNTEEAFIEEEEINIGTVTRFPTSRLMESVFDKEFYDYDYTANQFLHRNIESKSVTDEYFSKTFMDPTKVVKKTLPISPEAKLQYLRRGTYWNNDFAIYDDLATHLTKNNALMVETSGMLLRFPAMMVSVEIDRPKNELTVEDPQVLQDLMTRYQGLEGVWISSRVHSYVYPPAGRFRQILTLMRNYTNNIKDQKK